MRKYVSVIYMCARIGVHAIPRCPPLGGGGSLPFPRAPTKHTPHNHHRHQRQVLAGASLGGAVAVDFAHAHPEAVEKLVSARVRA